MLSFVGFCHGGAEVQPPAYVLYHWAKPPVKWTSVRDLWVEPVPDLKMLLRYSETPEPL